MSNMDKVHAFIRGLKAATKRELRYQAVDRLEDAIQYAIQFEGAMFQDEGEPRNNRGFRRDRGRMPQSRTRREYHGPVPMQLDAMVGRGQEF